MSDGKARILNPPARIWLVYGDIPYDLEHDSFDAEDLTYCYGRTGDSDVEYVNVAEVARLTADLAAANNGWNEASADRHRLLLEVRQLDADLAAARAERDEYRAARIAYASEFSPDEEGHPDTGNVHANIRALKAERDNYEQAMKDAVQVSISLTAERDGLAALAAAHLCDCNPAAIAALHTPPNGGDT